MNGKQPILIQMLILLATYQGHAAAPADKTDATAIHNYLQTYFGKKFEQRPLLSSISVNGLVFNLLNQDALCQLGYGTKYVAWSSTHENVLVSDLRKPDHKYYVLASQKGGDNQEIKYFGIGSGNISLVEGNNKVVAKKDTTPNESDPWKKVYALLVETKQDSVPGAVSAVDSLDCRDKNQPLVEKGIPKATDDTQK